MTDIEGINRLRGEARDTLQEALYEIKRVIVGQDAMLERLLVSLLAHGHVLLEGVPGLAKTLTVKTLAAVLGGTYNRVQFTPDLVPADLVGTRIYRPDSGKLDTELGPVFANFLLADEINRAPAKVQSALLEVMQERQVTIGHDTHRVPEPFLVLATQNPIESEGTYPLPEAQVDRFMFKLVVDYPSTRDEVAVVERSLETGTRAREVLSPAALAAHQRAAAAVYVDRRVMEYAVALTTATRAQDDEGWVEFGASPGWRCCRSQSSRTCSPSAAGGASRCATRTSTCWRPSPRARGAGTCRRSWRCSRSPRWWSRSPARSGPWRPSGARRTSCS